MSSASATHRSARGRTGSAESPVQHRTRPDFDSDASGLSDIVAKTRRALGDCLSPQSGTAVYPTARIAVSGDLWIDAWISDLGRTLEPRAVRMRGPGKWKLGSLCRLKRDRSDGCGRAPARGAWDRPVSGRWEFARRPGIAQLAARRRLARLRFGVGGPMAGSRLAGLPAAAVRTRTLPDPGALGIGALRRSRAYRPQASTHS
jgi:hypothetical protein